MKLVSLITNILALSTVVANAALADQIDYVIQFNNGADRTSDAATAQDRDDSGNPLPSYSMLVDMTRISTGNPVPGTFVLISSARDLPRLDGHTKLYLELDRDKCTAGLVGCIIASHAGAGLLQDIQFSPLYMGAQMSWGNLR